MARDETRRQLELQLEPLPPEELDHRDSSQVKGAAEIMANDKFGMPYYYGIERLCAMATNNLRSCCRWRRCFMRDFGPNWSFVEPT